MHLGTPSSTQRVHAYRGGTLVDLTLPSAECQVAGHDLRWGAAEEIGSPAYWAAQAWMWEMEEPDHYRLGSSLREEALACILGGYGIPAEVGMAAFSRLREVEEEDLFDEALVHEMLTAPLLIEGRSVRYRFARQKARHIARSMPMIREVDGDLSDRDLRDALMKLSGIGPKTASWIVRNSRGSDQVSILDVHIVRACRALGILKAEWRVERHYSSMENAYLAFAAAIGARASILDSVIWMSMRRLPASIVQSMLPKRFKQADRKHSHSIDNPQSALL